MGKKKKRQKSKDEVGFDEENRSRNVVNYEDLDILSESTQEKKL